MQAPLVFRTQRAPLDTKVLTFFRKDAGWTDADNAGLNGAYRAGSKVCWVTVESSKKTIGIARLELAPPQFCFISGLVILSDYRGRGVGEWLLENVERYCLAQGIPRILLQPVERAKGFYEKLHFIADPLVAGFLKKEISPLKRKILPY